ncbi:superoxide dismutase [Theileria orientalis strain Shintoku]|uniref:Superoxide dismutase [Fe] n=1 Tax=Theileria orientalis strain Shintoku TaxID=869250 RepID=J7MCF4_THEOR|nr:superoxide dismutase [Theileria orientalis strain Shintoku]BAM42477.1 superoxide dismutase [Theileria orientalis strain Shintoku]|eukprot:XP_009692778.1 superoxide dismutase [Theileria orientalis strain Shintoku]
MKIRHTSLFLICKSPRFHCLCCVNRLSKEISKSCSNFIKITREKTNIITKTGGVLDSYFEIHNSELFIEPIILDSGSLTVEINIHTLFESLSSTLRSDYIILTINDKEDENLYIKYLDSIYSEIDITLKIPVSILPDCSNKLPEIPFTNYNLNLVKLQTISFLLYSLNRIGNDVVEFEISKRAPSEENLFNKCILTLRSEGAIVNLETKFYEFKVFSSYPSEEEEVIEEVQDETISIFVNTNSLNILLKSIIEANLYNQTKSLIIISIPEDYNISRNVYIIISIINVRFKTKIRNIAGYLIISWKKMKILIVVLVMNRISCYVLNSNFNYFQTIKLNKLFTPKDGFKLNVYDKGTAVNENKVFELMKLPYVMVTEIFTNMDELDPDISKETVEYHYLKHHQGYVNKLNELGKTHRYVFNYTLEELIKMEPKNNSIYNLACQIWNHDFYWLGLDPKGSGRPNLAVEQIINDSFESFSNFKKEFTETAMKHFGSGWVWLLYYKHKPHLRIVDTHDADNPMKLFNTYPLLVLDVWEHAYYIDHRNDRKSYIDKWFNKINWNRVENLLEHNLK